MSDENYTQDDEHQMMQAQMQQEEQEYQLYLEELAKGAENMADMKNKGRRKGINNGDKNGRSKLNQSLADEIRNLKHHGLKLKELAIKFDVGISTISRVCRKENWA